ncbi:MAG TPA: ATP-binding protein, partial [Firmicutes bacterium]|nr:ATP-binding protein [Bacillota bacterium]
ALKFTPPGGRVEVTVESRAVRPGSTGEVRVSVTDTGGGIAPKDLPYVFERLYRSRREGTRGEEGAGIGLAIAQALARAHGGRVEARSELGKGSTFTLILPLR